MNDWHLEKAFAPTPQVVLSHMDEALEEVHTMKQTHRKPTAVLILAIVLVLAMAGGAIAASLRWGMSDFLAKGYRIGNLLPEAREAIQTSVPQEGGALEGITFTLQEALCDSRYAWLVFDVTTSEEDTLLVFGGMSTNLPASQLSPDLPEDVTIAQWAADSGYARITTVRLEQEWNTKDEFILERLDWHWQPDGTVSVIVMGPYTKQEPGDLRFICRAMPWWSNGAEQHPFQEAPITVTIAPGKPLWTADWSGSAMLPDSDITIEHIELVGTIASMYCEITYVGAQDRLEKDSPLVEWLRLVDEQGQQLMWGAGTGLSDIRTEKGVETHGIKLPLDNNRFMLATTYAALPEPPETLRICGIRTEGSETVHLGIVEIPLE